MVNPFAPLAPLAALFSGLFNTMTEPIAKIFSTTNDTHRTERLIVQGFCMLIIMPLLTIVIAWRFILSPLLMSGDANNSETTSDYGSYDDSGL
mmetsp:Transcript_15480/g.25811  ORF Transcript_15480/g.25811 Transcript_15480/m.25811 type:complete len:93 (+) Transcript_15480:296-574(+)